MQREPVVGVFGGADVSTEVQRTARTLGEAIAQQGWVLLNGGRNAGVMRASAQGASQAGGLVVGILPSAGPEDPSADVAPAIDVAVFTDMGEARNNVNVLSCNAAILLPGGAGTLSEAALAVKIGTPLVLLDWDPGEVPAVIEQAADRVDTVPEAVEFVEQHLEQGA